MEHNFIKTTLPIKDIICCQECPLSLGKKDNLVELGTGNIITDTVFILPYYNRNKNVKSVDLLELLSKCYKEIYKENILDKYYITVLPKCHSNEIYVDDTYKIVYQSMFYCLNFLAAELKHYCTNLKNVIFCGTIFNELVENYINMCFEGFNIKIISNPIHYTGEYKDKFINELKEALYV